jgi:hypothetical protein
MLGIYPHRPNWLRFSPGKRFARGDAFYREFVCIAGSVSLRLMAQARRESGLSRAIIYRADVDGVEEAFEIRAGRENKFSPRKLREL